MRLTRHSTRRKQDSEQLSTQDSLPPLSNDAIDRPSCCDPRIAAAIDIRRAFDSVIHEAILKGTCRCGIKGKAFAFIESFLTGRSTKSKLGEPKDRRQLTASASHKDPSSHQLYLTWSWQTPHQVYRESQASGTPSALTILRCGRREAP